jgi:hypothetical protein
MGSEMSEKETLVPIEAASTILASSEEELTRLARRGVIPKILKGQVPLIRTVTRLIKHLRAGNVTLEEAGAAMGITAPWVLHLISEGYIERHSLGGVSLIQAQAGYIRWLKDEDRRSSKSAAESGLKAARQREVEVRTAERERRLIDVTEHSDIVDELCGLFIAGLASLPARVTRDVSLRRKVESECDAIRNDIAARAAERARDVGAGRTAADRDAEDDA